MPLVFEVDWEGLTPVEAKRFLLKWIEARSLTLADEHDAQRALFVATGDLEVKR